MTRYVPPPKPVISGHQAFLLNRIEIGQFLYMKYSIGHNRPIAVYAVIESLKAGKLLLKPKNNCIETGTLITSTKPKPVGYLLFKACPCLLMKILSSVYLTLLALASKYGTKENVKMNDNKAKIGMKKANTSIRVALTVIPSQNIKFQKLSLFSRALIKFITTSPIYLLKIIFFIVSRFKVWGNIISLSTAILMANLSIADCLAEDIAELIHQTERKYAIPSGLLKAIAKVESANQPYVLNIAGKSVLSKSKEQAEKIVRSLLKQGQTNIDLGMMQINWRWHGQHFHSINEMLEPKHNIEYAAKLLTQLYQQHDSWSKAVRFYHSAKPEYYQLYAKKILLAWLNG